MYSGPFNTPLALARQPFMVLFWVVIAPYLFRNITLALLTVLSPETVNAEAGEPMPMQDVWMFMTISSGLMFVAVSMWAEKIGAGPFAGSLWSSETWFLIAAGLAPIVFMVPGTIISGLFSHGDPEWMYRSEGYSEMFGAGSFGLIMIVYIVFLGPLLEEVIFRGVALGCLLARGWNPLHAMLLSSAVFTGLHYQYVLPAMIPVFIMGMFLAWLRVRSGSIAVPIVAHMAANGISMALFWLSLSAA